MMLMLAPTTRVISAPTEQCGSWRWNVKTLSDPDASRVNFSPVARTIAQLHSLHPPTTLTTSTPRIAPTETHGFRVRAQLREYALEADHDVHVVIADPASFDMTMVAEIVDPACPGARDSPRLDALRAVRQKFISLYGQPSRGSFRPVPGQPVAVVPDERIWPFWGSFAPLECTESQKWTKMMKK